MKRINWWLDEIAGLPFFWGGGGGVSIYWAWNEIWAKECKVDVCDGLGHKMEMIE